MESRTGICPMCGEGVRTIEVNGVTILCDRVGRLVRPVRNGEIMFTIDGKQLWAKGCTKYACEKQMAFDPHWRTCRMERHRKITQSKLLDSVKFD